MNNIKTTTHISQKNTINTIILAAKGDNEQDIDILIITVDSTNINENGCTDHIINTYDKYAKNIRVVASNNTTLNITNTKEGIANINCISDILIIVYNPEVIKYLNIIDTDINSRLTIDDISVIVSGSMPVIKSSFNIVEKENKEQKKDNICRSVSDMIKINDDPIAKVTVDVDNIVTIQPIVHILGTPRFATIDGISASYGINASDDDLNTELQNILSRLDILHSKNTIEIVDSLYDVQLSMRNNISSDRITNLYFNDSRYPNINIYGMLNTKYDDEYMIDLFEQNSKSGQLLYLTTKVLDTFIWIF